MNQIVQWFDLGGAMQLARPCQLRRHGAASSAGFRGCSRRLSALGLSAKRADADAGLGRGVRARGPVRAQAHQPQRRAAASRGEERKRETQNRAEEGRKPPRRQFN